MISLRDSKFQQIENPRARARLKLDSCKFDAFKLQEEDVERDEAVLNTLFRQSVVQVSDMTHIHDNDRFWGTSMLYTEDEKPINDSAISDSTQHLNEPCSSFHDQDYIEKINKFQIYIDMVKEMVKPGCSPEMLNVALSSISSLFETLSVLSSKHYIHASL